MPGEKIMISEKESKEIFEYLKSKLDLPENIISIEIKLGVGLATEVNCNFYPNKKEIKK